MYRVVYREILPLGLSVKSRTFKHVVVAMSFPEFRDLILSVSKAGFQIISVEEVS